MIFQTVVDIRSEFDSNGLYQLGGEGGQALSNIISSFVPLAITLAAVALFLYLIWGGYNWLTAGGDKAKVEDARNRITNALIGLTIVASAFAIFSLIDHFFGINLVQQTSSPTQGITCTNCFCGNSGYCDGACFNDKHCAPR